MGLKEEFISVLICFTMMFSGSFAQMCSICEDGAMPQNSDTLLKFFPGTLPQTEYTCKELHFLGVYNDHNVKFAHFLFDWRRFHVVVVVTASIKIQKCPRRLKPKWWMLQSMVHLTMWYCPQLLGPPILQIWRRFRFPRVALSRRRHRYQHNPRHQTFQVLIRQWIKTVPRLLRFHRPR